MDLNAESRIAVARRRGRGRRRMRWGSFHHRAAGEAWRGCRQRSGAPPYPPAGWSRIPRTDDSRAEGWRLASGRGPEHRPPFLLPTGPTVITARKK